MTQNARGVKTGSQPDGPDPVTPTQVAAQRVRHYRKAHGWSAQELARRCAEAGMPNLDRSVLSNLENGRRAGLRLDEVLTLAWVLGVPPVMLMVPLGWADDVSITPTVTVHPGLAMRWLTGDEQAPTSDRRIAGHVNHEVYTEAVRPVVLYGRLTEAQELLGRAEHGREKIRTNDGQRTPPASLDGLDRDDASRIRAAELRWKGALASLATVLNHMVAMGVRPPAIWRPRLEAMKRMKLLLQRTVEEVPALEGEDAEDDELLADWYGYAPQAPDVTDVTDERPEPEPLPSSKLHEMLLYNEELKPVMAAIRTALEAGVEVRMIQDVVPIVDMFRRAF
ncbi:helix-turn-helix transcriptional regulator [Microtetraspora sp. AC03309]|uniref:helix-turn-helix domain-containing protein n=1 Tax=Microtetraspora sp. AC03309 TaxID=2779376 RepID=UPI001E50581B|nr:helix-turn-helix transcriptional regulator [Microtetraspora sp. AC03309]MCC5582038.1 helix-turn-helix transcriptional regulator [Microtetraspora sp. AC03309]